MLLPNSSSYTFLFGISCSYFLSESVYHAREFEPRRGASARAVFSERVSDIGITLMCVSLFNLAREYEPRRGASARAGLPDRISK